jgi:hypothetical protein
MRRLNATTPPIATKDRNVRSAVMSQAYSSGLPSSATVTRGDTSPVPSFMSGRCELSQDRAR